MLKLPAYFTGFASKVDGSASLRFTTQEIPAEIFADLKRSHNAFGWLLFSETDIEDTDVPDDLPDDSKKTPAQRLRAVLFAKWKQEGETGDFTTYYRSYVEKIIEHIKSKLT